MFGMMTAPKRTIRLDDGTEWDPSTALPPDVGTVFNRNGFSGTPMGSPLTPPLKGDWRLPTYEGGQTPPLTNRGPVQANGGLFGNLVPSPASRSGPHSAPVGSLPMNPAPQAYRNPLAAGDWGGNAQTLPSGREAGPLVDPSAMALPQLNSGVGPVKPKFFDQGGLGQRLAGILGPALLGASNPQLAMSFIQSQANARREDARNRQQDMFEREKFDWQKKKDMRPDVKAVGRSVVSVPFEGDPSVLYQAPTDAESYAASLGYKEGDEQYPDAIMDYVLRSSGPTAYENRRELEDLRNGNRRELRGLPTYRDLHPRAPAPTRGGSGSRPPRSTGEAIAPILAKLSRGEALTPGEQQALSFYGRRGGGKLTGFPNLPAPNPPGPSRPSPSTAGPAVRVRTPAEARGLAPGTVFITPDGRRKVR